MTATVSAAPVVTEAAVAAELDRLRAERVDMTGTMTGRPPAERATIARRWVENFTREAAVWRHVTSSRARHDLLSRAATAAEIGAREAARSWEQLAEQLTSAPA